MVSGSDIITRLYFYSLSLHALKWSRDIPLEEFQRMISINLTASFLLVKGVISGMKKQRWGRIIFVSSIAAYGAGLNGCRTYFTTPVATLSMSVECTS